MLETAATTATDDDFATKLNGIPTAEIRAELEHVLRSRAFIQSHRIRRFLQFVVEESLLGQPHRLKEYLIGLEVFDRREAFDPRVDSIVRVEARRLRTKLEEYYRTEGRDDQVRIVLRKGSYVPLFEYRNAVSSYSQKRAIEIAPFTLLNAPENAVSIGEEIQRRLAHVLIKEGCFQVTTHAPANLGVIGNPEVSVKPDYVVEGSIEFQPEGFQLIAQLLQSADGSYICSESIRCQSIQDLSAVEQGAQALLRELLASTSEAAPVRRQDVPKEGRDFYVQGRYNWKLATPDSIRNSVQFFTSAVESDANYAAAWAALAEALLVSSMFGFLAPNETDGRMKEAALKASSLNPSLPEAHVALGAVMSILDWDWAGGEQELQKSIQLDVHDPIGHIAYGIQLACRGSLEAAVMEVERALEADPAALFPNFVLGWLYGVSHRFDEAISQHLLVAQLAPDYALPHLGLGMAYAGKRMFGDAIAHFTNASQMKCPALLRGHLGYCYAMADRVDEAQREIAGLSSWAESHYVSQVSFAAVYSGLGEHDRSLTYLEQALELRDPALPVHLLNPEFDNLRNEPRFVALRQRIGLVPA